MKQNTCKNCSKLPLKPNTAVPLNVHTKLLAAYVCRGSEMLTAVNKTKRNTCHPLHSKWRGVGSYKDNTQIKLLFQRLQHVAQGRKP